MYAYCPYWALNWEYRWKLFLLDMQDYDPSIICLQVSIILAMFIFFFFFFFF